MLFNSLAFFWFFPIVFCLYWALYRYRVAQNVLILCASYFFYCWWKDNRDVNYAFSYLLLFSSSLGYAAALVIEKVKSDFNRKVVLGLSILIHLAILGYFKYYNFSIHSLNSLSSLAGSSLHLHTRSIILPLAISFFTFHIIGYTIDVYRRDYSAAKDYINFITHIAFFPQLVAGPIERGGHLLPQFRQERQFDVQQLVSGMRQALWGFFKKLAIADSLSLQVDYIFKNHQSQSGSTLLIGALMFSIQIYCDFSGYTDIALGIGRMLGIELLTNFKFPYFATSISQFWHRWHISLSTWFRDYVYIPLGGSRVKSYRKYLNLLIVFMVSGLWHGAKWTFVIWGGIHGVIMVLDSAVSKILRFPSNKLILTFKMLLTFAIVTVAWVFFRAPSVHDAFSIIGNIFSKGITDMPSVQNNGIKGLLCALLLFVVEWIQKDKLFGLDVRKMHYTIRWTAYVVLVMIIFSSDNLNQQRMFIYFQF